MTARSVLRMAVAAVLAAAAVYTVVTASGEYFEAVRLVEHSVQAAGKAERLATSVGPSGIDWASEVRAAIVHGAVREGLSIDPGRVAVSQHGSTLRVRFKWSSPLLMTGDSVVLGFPLTVDRTYDLRSEGGSR